MSTLRLQNIIFLLLSGFLLIDSINGYLLLKFSADLKISAIYKSIILGLILVSLFYRNKVYLLGIISLFLIFLTGEFFSVISLSSSTEKTSFAILHSIKVLAPIIIFVFLVNQEKRKVFYEKLDRVMVVNFIIFSINIMLGLFGFGFSTYDGNLSQNSVGFKGFFYAGNEISALFVLFCGFYLYKSFLKSFLRYLLTGAYFIFLALLISTKTSILSAFLLLFLIPIMSNFRSLFVPNNKYFLFNIIFVLIFTIQFSYIFILFQETNFFNRLEYIYTNSGILGVLFSSRDIYLLDMWDLYLNNLTIFSLFFGNGITFYADLLKFSVEIDLIDIFFWHGILGLIAILFIYLKLSNHSLTNFFNNDFLFSRMVILVNLLLLMVSSLSGHVFTSGMLGILWPIFCVYSYKLSK